MELVDLLSRGVEVTQVTVLLTEPPINQSRSKRAAEKSRRGSAAPFPCMRNGDLNTQQCCAHTRFPPHR